MVTVILGIMAALAVIKYQKAIANNELEKTSNCIYSEIRGVRAISSKWDAKTVIKFSAKACSIYVDTSWDGILQPNELIRVLNIPKPISIGVPSNGPTKSPNDSILWSTTGICDLWGPQGMVINADPTGSINKGAICLKSDRISDVAYCIALFNQISPRLYKGIKTTWTIIR
jgi:type II secretory pathway pseudopilin PulG